MASTVTFKHIFIAFLIGTIMLFIFGYFASQRPEKLPFENKINLKLLWKKSFEQTINPSWVITRDGKLYLHEYRTDKLLILNTADGKIQKKINLPQEYYDVNIEKDDDKIYFIGNEKDFYTIDQEDGRITDKYLNDRKLLYSENIIKHKQYYIFWNIDGEITVLDTNNGKVNNKN
ncbi:MAG: hypothetical protein ACOC2W_04070, partial [bacterium]